MALNTFDSDWVIVEKKKNHYEFCISSQHNISYKGELNAFVNYCLKVLNK